MSSSWKFFATSLTLLTSQVMAMVLVMVMAMVVKNVGCDKNNDSLMLFSSCEASFVMQYQLHS